MEKQTNPTKALIKKFQKLIGAQDHIEDFNFSPADEFPSDLEQNEQHLQGTSQDDENDFLRRRADVPVGPSEHDKKVPPSVAQGD